MIFPPKKSFEQQPKSTHISEKSQEAFEGLLELLVDLATVETKENEIPKSEVDSDLTNKKEASTQEKRLEDNLKQNLQKSNPQKLDKGDVKKTEKQDDLKSENKQIENQINLPQKQYYEPDEVINLFLPLMAELLDSPVESQEKLKQSITPIIDEIIKTRSQQDRLKMSEAIADILPGAIAQQIKNSPQEIAKAIAPEMALAIQNQIDLDREAIAQTLGPEMGQAIKTQIEVERDAMVDALYPVIGNTISKYMVELAKSINDKVENALSIEGVTRKIRAKIQGISEAELILQESMNFSVQAVLLIHKASGLIISEVQPPFHPLKEADLFAGMLSAIRDFVTDCVASVGKTSELHEIEYDDAKIILEVAGYCYLAVIIKGEPSKKFIHKIRQTLSQIILKNGRVIENFKGDQTTIPSFIKPKLEKLVEVNNQPKKSKPPFTLIGILSLIVIIAGIIFYRGKVAQYWEQQIIEALDAAPELSVYRIIPQVQRGELILRGRVPNASLKEQAANVGQQVVPHLTLKNQIMAVNVPPDAQAIASEVQRVTDLLNQTEGVDIKTRYQDHTVTITGFVFNLNVIERISQAFQPIPGVDKIISTTQTQPHLDTRIYFQPNASQFKANDIAPKIKIIQQLLAEHPQIHLRIIGHSDPRGTAEQNQTLAKARAEAVKKVLIQNHVDPRRLTVSTSLQRPPGVMSDQPLWLSRCVRFEVFFPPN